MIYRFGAFELDEQAGELRRGGEVVSLQPKPFALLCLLVRERDRIVTQDELFEALWPETAVTSSSLTRAGSHARRAVDDTHRGSLLRSIPRRGYRFTGEVAEIRGRAAEPRVAATSDFRPGSAAVPAREVASGDVFVGREDALAKLREAWRRAQSGDGRLVLVGGAAGIGKTRLSEVFAREVSDRGGLAVFGRSRDGEGVPAFWLWSQALRGLAQAGLVEQDDDWEHLLARSGNSADPEQRFRFFDAVARGVIQASKARPVTIVLEDLQWAQSPSLRLLEHLSFEVEHSRLLLIGTVRNEPRERGHPLSRCLSVLRKHACCDQVELTGLSRGDIGQLLGEVIGRPAPAELTSELFARSEGVPLFVREAVRLLAERGDLKQPERIRRRGITLPAHAVDLIRRSLEALSPPCAELVAAGAVLGRELPLAAVAAVADISREEALDLMDEAVASGVLEEVPDTPATYRFVHALFQEAAYEGLQRGRRARLHCRAAERLESQHADDPTPVIAELAHHHHQSLAVGSPELAFECAIAAADEAARNFAYEQAATHYEQAVDALEHGDIVNPDRRLAVLIELGEAHRRAGDREKRREVSRRAMESARTLGRSREFALAAVRFCDVNEWSPEDSEATAVVDEALAGLDADATALRASLMARQAYLGIRHPGCLAIARDAVRLGRESEDPETLQETLYVLHYALAGPDHLEERRNLARELVEAARQSDSHDTAVIALLDIACDHLSVGDHDAALAMREETGRLASDLPSPSIAWHTSVFDAGLALLEGRTLEVEQMMADSLLLGRRITHPYAQACFNGQQMLLYRYRQDHEAIRPLFSRALSSKLGPNHWARAVMGRTELRLGNESGARELWENLAEDDFEGVARGIRWVGTLVETAHLCADLDDAPRAERLVKLLGPEEELHGILPIPVLYGGPVSYCLARLQEVLGVADLAVQYYEHALEGAKRMHARPMQARIQQDFAKLLERRGDRTRAEALAREGRELEEATGCRL